MIIFVFAGCGYQLCTDMTQEKIQKLYNIKSIVLCSYDPFGLITRAIRTELCANKINIFDDLNDIAFNQDKLMTPYLYIIKASENYVTTSVFKNGKAATYQLILYVQTNLLIPNKNTYPINIRVSRFFIKNPEKFLINDTQENDIRKDMYQDAAQKLVYKLFLIYKDFY